MDVNTMLCMLTVGTVISWIFRKLNLSDVVGYVLGGAVASAVLITIGINVESGLSYLEPLRWLGLTLFSFTIGASIGLRKIIEGVHRVVAAELVIYVVLWIVGSFIALTVSLGYIERTALFVALVNSSTVATVALIRGKFKVSVHTRDRAIIQTSMEDLAQFVLFTLMFVAGISIAQDLFRALTQLFMVIGVALILIMVARYALTFLSRTRFVSDRENKFVMVVGIAILFASVASTLGLPPLFGAFLAGISFSSFLSLDDVSDMVDGVKSLGLLMYFTSLGAQLYLISVNLHGSLDVIAVGILLGAVAFLLRVTSISLAMLFTGNDLSESLSLALFLSPLSEMSIVFIDVLAQRGVLSLNLVAEVAVAVITSLILFGAITPRVIDRVSGVERFVPPRVSNFFKYLSNLYMKRTDVAISMLTPIIKFTAVSLLISYMNSLVIDVVEWFKLPIALAILFSLASSAVILVIFILTLRNIFGQFLRHTVSSVGRISEAFGKMLDLMVGSLAVVLQVHMFYEVSLRTLPIEPLYVYVTLGTGIVVVIVTFYELVRYYFKISLRRY